MNVFIIIFIFLCLRGCSKLYHLAYSNKIQSVFSKSKTLCFSEDGFLLNLLLSLRWIPLGGESQFLYLLGGDNLYLIRVVSQNSYVSLVKFLWVVLLVSLWIYLGCKLIYLLDY